MFHLPQLHTVDKPIIAFSQVFDRSTVNWLIKDALGTYYLNKES